MNPVVRELITIAGTLGFTPDPDHTGTGHIMLRHPNGTVTLPSTPSEYRGRKNAIAQMERIAGRRLPRPNHRRGRGPRDGTDFDPTRACQENQSWHQTWDPKVTELSQQRDAAIDEFRKLRQDGTRTAVAKARDVLSHIAHLEERLTTFGQPVSPFNPLTD